jgi:hypothetical protein
MYTKNKSLVFDIEKFFRSVISIKAAALAAALVAAGTAAAVASDHMAFGLKKSTSALSLAAATTGGSGSRTNSGIKVVNFSDQRNTKCSTAGESSAITGAHALTQQLAPLM